MSYQSTDAQAEFSRWSEGYDRDLLQVFFFNPTHKMLLAELTAADRRILDVGCGTGDYVELADKHDGQFFGIDYAPEMIRQAKERFAGHNQRHLFAVASGEHVPYADNTFDLAVGMGYIEYFPDPAVPIRELRRVLKPGGTLVMQSFKWQMWSHFRRLVWQPLRGAVKGNGQDGLPSSWVNNKYGRRQLDALLGAHGFRNVGHVHNNFHVFPTRVRLRFPRAYMRLSEWIGRTTPNALGFLAVNYVGKYRLEKNDAS